MRTLATLRFACAALDPQTVTDLLGHSPSRGYRVGEVFRAGPRGPEQTGKSGLWFLSTHKLVASDHLDAHTSFIARLLATTPEHPLDDPGFRAIQDFVEKEAVAVTGSCFWAGRADEPAPAVPPVFTDLISRLHGTVEIAFDHDPAEPARRLHVA